MSKNKLMILLIFALAFALRMIYLEQYQQSNIYPLLEYSDSYSYHNWARDIISGDLIGSGAFMKWPLYAYFLAFLFKLFGDNPSLVYFLQAILGSINVCLIFLIGSKLFNRYVGLIASLLCLSFGLFIFYDGLLLYTSVSLLLNSLFFLYLLKIKDNPEKKNLFLLGIFLGICTLAQASILIFGILAAIWVLKLNQQRLKKIFINFLFFIFGLAVIIAPVTLRNYLLEKDFVLLAGNTGINFYLGNNPYSSGTFFCPKNIGLNQEDMFRDARIIAQSESGKRLKTSQVSAYWFKKAGEFIKQEPLKFLKLMLKKLGYVFGPREFVHESEYGILSARLPFFKFLLWDLRLILPFAFLGMFLGMRKLKQAALLYLYLIPISLAVSLFFISARYRITVVPVIMIFTALGIYELAQQLIKRRFAKFSLFLVGLIIIFSLLECSVAASKKADAVEKKKIIETDYYLSRVSELENSGSIKAAISELTFAQQVDPENSRIWFLLGNNYYRLHDFKIAQEMFLKVIKSNPLSVDSYYNLGLIYNQEMRFAQGRDMLLKAVALNPDGARAQFELAMSYKSLAEFDKAKEHMQLALKKINRWRKIDIEIIKKELASLKNEK